MPGIVPGLGLFKAGPYQCHGPVVGVQTVGVGAFVDTESFHPMIHLAVIQGQNGVALLIAHHVYPGGNTGGGQYFHGAVDVLDQGEIEQNAVLGVAGLHPHFTDPLVGNGIAGGIDDQGLMVLVLGGGQQIHRFDDMGMAAHDDVNAHIAQLLGDLHLVIRGLQLVLFAPVHIHHDGFRAFGLHSLKLSTDFGVEFVQLAVIEGVDGAEGIGGGLNGVDGGNAGHAVVGLGGIGSHAHLDAVDLDDLVIRILLAHLGAQTFQTGLGQDFQGALNTAQTGIIAMVIAGEEHIKAGVQGTDGDAIGAVEQGIAGIGVGRILTAKGGFQVCHRVVGGLDVGGHMGKEAVKDPVAGFLIPAALEHGLMHQQVAGDGEAGGGGDDFDFRRGRRGGNSSGRHRGFSGKGGFGSCGIGRLGFLTEGQEILHQKQQGGAQNQDQKDQQGNQGGSALLCVFTGHWEQAPFRYLWRRGPAGSEQNGRFFRPGYRCGGRGG